MALSVCTTCNQAARTTDTGELEHTTPTLYGPAHAVTTTGPLWFPLGVHSTTAVVLTDDGRVKATCLCGWAGIEATHAAVADAYLAHK